jgi:hypothetical protein
MLTNMIRSEEYRGLVKHVALSFGFLFLNFLDLIVSMRDG